MNSTTKTTFAKAMQQCRLLGFSLTQRDGEYRVAPRDATREVAECRAYYTTDLDDAVDTARYEYRNQMEVAA